VASPVILGIGNPLLDISAEVPSSLLDKYQLKLNNATLAEQKDLPLYKELVDNFKVDYIAGGATQNSIRVAQWMIQAPHSTAYIGCIGKDSFGEQLTKSAQADGVMTLYQTTDAHPTGTCAVCVHEKERSLVANLGAANHYQPEHLDQPDVEQVWKNAKIYYSAGFFLTVSPPALMKIAKHANETGKYLCMNLSAPFITQFFTEPLLAALPYCDIMFGNESEAEAFGARMNYSDKSVSAIALRIATAPKLNASRHRLCIITQGSSSTIVASGDGTVTEYPVPPLDSKLIVDSNGAGDSFVGGFLSQLAQGKSIADCVRAGHYAARTILQVSGCAPSGTPADASTW